MAGGAFSARSVRVHGRDIRFWEAGGGEPVMVLHGASGPRPSLALDLLAREFRVLPFEMPGWGPHPADDGASVGDLAETMAAAADAIGLDRYHVLGTSLGGAVALLLGLGARDSVVSVVLEAPVTFQEGFRPVEGRPEDEVMRAFRLHPEREPSWESWNRSEARRPYVRSLIDSLAAGVDETQSRMAASDLRVLVLFGESDGVVAAENGRTFRRLLANSSFQIVHDAAHDIQGDRPEAFADVVGDFLRRGMAFLVPDRETLINP